MTEHASQTPVHRISLPRAAVLGLNVERAADYPESALWQELRQQRAEQRLEAARSAGIREISSLGTSQEQVAESVAPDTYGRKFARDSGRTGFQDINANYANQRRSLSMIGIALGAPKLVGRLRHLTQNETILVDSDKGYAFAAQAIRPGLVSWNLELDKESSPDERDAAMDAFTESVRAQNQNLNTTKRELSEGLRANQFETYGTVTYTWEKDADELIAFLNMSVKAGENVPAVRSNDGPALQRAAVIEGLYALPAHYSNETPNGLPGERHGIYFSEHGAIEKVLVAASTPGLYYALKPAEAGRMGDLTEIPLHLGVEVHADETYVEVDGNGRYYEHAVPFIETPAAAQLMAVLDHAGVRLSGEARGIVAETDLSRRFGHGYAALTREIAKIINDPERPLDALFEDNDGRVAERLQALEGVNDPAARIVLGLLHGIANRTAPAPDGAVVLPVTANRIKMRDGSCKDIEVYIASGRPESLDTAEPPVLWRTSYNRPTAMTLQTTYLNGVELPAGTLLAVENDGYAMLRVTSFALGDADAALTFGAQEAHNRIVSGGLNRSRLARYMQ